MGIKGENGRFWQFKNLADGSAELLLYGEIKSEKSWLDDMFELGGVYADQFIKDLKALGDVGEITCRINSVGGDIFAAVAIYTQLKTHPAKVTCIVDGLAASAATIILMAGDEIQMPAGAMLMIHDPLAMLYGLYNADALGKAVDTLTAIKESIISVYTSRSGASAEEISALMSQETWMGADRAMELGFCDTKLASSVKAEMKGQVMFVNSVEHDLSRFKTQPELDAAKNILDTIAAHNAGSDVLTQFVALAKGTAQAAPEPASAPSSEEPAATGETGEKPTGTEPAPAAADGEISDAGADDAQVENTLQRLVNRYPKLTSLMSTRAKAEERQRIRDIDAIAGHVDPGLLAKAKYEDVAMTAKDVAFAQMQGTKGRAAAFLAEFREDTTTSGVKDVGSAPNTFADQSKDQERATIGERIANVANKILNGRK